MINLAKLKALVTLAVNHAAAPGESRNAAVAACHMIHEGGFDFGTSEPQQPSVGPRPVRMITARFDGPCVFCDRPIRAGMPIYYQKYFGAWHTCCAISTGGSV